MAAWIRPAEWGLLAASALIFGAAIGYWVTLPQRVVAGIMAFGSGTLIAALTLVLMQDAYAEGGYAISALGFLAGAALFSATDMFVRRHGGARRKRSAPQQAAEGEASGMAIAAGSLMDNVPEMLVLGIGLAGGQKVNAVMLIAIFLSNLPEGLSSAAGLRRAGRPALFVFSTWGAITVLSVIASVAGFLLFRGTDPAVIALASAVAAGAMLAMIADTMIPEAYEVTHELTGFITSLGFLVAFVVHHLQ